MPQTASTTVLGTRRPVRESSNVSFGAKYPTFIVVALVLMFVALIYVGSHIRMTRMEYEIAASLSAKELLLEEQKKLKLELAMLKAPQRIEHIAKTKLEMIHPDADQVIVIRENGK